MCKENSIYILLSRHYDLVSKVVYFLTGCGYTHASIGLVQEPDCFYSFTFKGFRKEKPARWKKNKDVRMMLYELEVSSESYEMIRDKIVKIQEEEDLYHYSSIGVLLCLLRIPHKRKNHYFCSQFVAELLTSSGAVQLVSKPSVCVPNTFIRELRENPNVRKVSYNPTFV